MRKALNLTTLLVAAMLALVGCGSNGTDSSSGSSVTHNQQDVTFATDMVPHHLQAWTAWTREAATACRG